MKKPFYLAEPIEAEFKNPFTRDPSIDLGRDERIYIETQHEDGSVEFRCGYPDSALLTYPTSLPLMEHTGTYSVALVGSLLGSGLYAGPGLTRSEAGTLAEEAVALHGRAYVEVTPDYRKAIH